MLTETNNKKLFCMDCFTISTISRGARHISVDNANINVFIDDKKYQCEKCKSFKIELRSSAKKIE